MSVIPALKYRDPADGTFKIFPVGNDRTVTVISTNTTAGSAADMDYVYLCSAALTLTLPTAVGNSNRYTVKRTGSGDITIATTSSQTIDGASTYTIAVANQAIDLISNGSDWAVI